MSAGIEVPLALAAGAYIIPLIYILPYLCVLVLTSGQNWRRCSDDVGIFLIVLKWINRFQRRNGSLFQKGVYIPTQGKARNGYIYAVSDASCQ